jgi:hypothetical protein
VSPKRSRITACDAADARRRLVQADAFLLTAEAADDHDVVATNAIHAAIAASDVLCCLGLGERSSGDDHQEAAATLQRVDKTLATKLRRCLALKTKAAYDSTSVSAQDARRTLAHATALVTAAQTALAAG